MNDKYPGLTQSRLQAFTRALNQLLEDVEDCYGAGLNHQVKMDMLELERAGHNLLDIAGEMANGR